MTNIKIGYCADTFRTQKKNVLTCINLDMVNICGDNYVNDFACKT